MSDQNLPLIEVTDLQRYYDLAVARYVADRIAVMQFGKFVEVGEAEQVIFNPHHAYSRELLANTLPVGNE